MNLFEVSEKEKGRELMKENFLICKRKNCQEKC